MIQFSVVGGEVTVFHMKYRKAKNWRSLSDGFYFIAAFRASAYITYSTVLFSAVRAYFKTRAANDVKFVIAYKIRLLRVKT